MTRFGVQDEFACEGCTYSETSVNQFNIVGPGPGNNILAKMVSRTADNFCTDKVDTVVELNDFTCR